MNEDNKEVVETTPVEETEETVDWKKVYMDFTKTAVSKEKYDKVKKELNDTVDNYKSVVNDMLNNQEVENVGPINFETEKASIRKSLFTGDCKLSNMAYVEKALRLRDLCIQTGEGDPFLPNSGKKGATADNVMEANKTAETLKSYLEQANGNPETFNLLISQIR